MQPKRFTLIVNEAGHFLIGNSSHCHSSRDFFIATTNKTKFCDGPSGSSVSGVYFHLSNNISTVGKNAADASHLPIVSRMSIARDKNNISESNVASFDCPFLSWKKSRQILSRPTPPELICHPLYLPPTSTNVTVVLSENTWCWSRRTSLKQKMVWGKRVIIFGVEGDRRKRARVEDRFYLDH